ncbi:hypothetical protein M426DRAFT_64179 [Hypoxylon sp. CI-4A]|nr:hypothetical protein M426DRAFT_64179 [Hypoxylon sp. CI-4A]
MAPQQSLSELASTIEHGTRALEDGLKGSSAATFSLSLGNPPQADLSPSLAATREELLETIDELRARLLGPLGNLMNVLMPTQAIIVIFQTLYKFGIATHVPLSPEGISYKDLAERSGLPEDNLRRILQSAITFRVFEEVVPDVSLRHNAVSSVLSAPQLSDLLGLFMDEHLTGALKQTEALVRFPGSGYPGHSASEEIEDPSKTYFDIIANDEKRVARFRSAMGVATKSLAFRASFFADNLPWADKNQAPATVVDIGGAGGEVLQTILRTHPNVKKGIVLDLPEVVAGAKAPEDLENRLEFKSYNFLTEQVQQQADAYIFRHIFHDWSDLYAAKILKNLVPALRKGTKVWLSEVVLPPLSDENHTKDQMKRSADLLMMSGFNAKERSRRDWENLLAAADTRLRIVNVTQPKDAHDAVIEIVFDE